MLHHSCQVYPLGVAQSEATEHSRLVACKRLVRPHRRIAQLCANIYKRTCPWLTGNRGWRIQRSQVYLEYHIDHLRHDFSSAALYFVPSRLETTLIKAFRGQSGAPQQDGRTSRLKHLI